MLSTVASGSLVAVLPPDREPDEAGGLPPLGAELVEELLSSLLERLSRLETQRVVLPPDR